MAIKVYNRINITKNNMFANKLKNILLSNYFCNKQDFSSMISNKILTEVSSIAGIFDV